MGKASLNHQLYSALQEAKALGESKRSYRASIGENKVDKIFSYSSYDSIKETSKSLARFIKNNFPEIKELKDINTQHICDFLKFKAQTCNDNSLTKIKMHIESLGIFAAKKYTSVDAEKWKINQLPEGSKPNDIRIGNAFSDMQLRKLENYASAPRRRNLSHGITLARVAGLRIDEIWSQKISDIHIAPTDKGDFGYGYLVVTDAKHGRFRTVSLISSEDQKLLANIIGSSDGEKIITCSKTQLQRMLSTAKKECNLDVYGQSWHAIRKSFAQNFYDFYRERHTRKQTIDKTNEALGHGRRQESKLKTYVSNMW